jgi:capreomycidine synthase
LPHRQLGRRVGGAAGPGNGAPATGWPGHEKAPGGSTGELISAVNVSRRLHEVEGVAAVDTLAAGGSKWTSSRASFAGRPRIRRQVVGELDFSPALLEDWMRQWYFDTDFDIGSSGVEDFSLAELRSLLRISSGDLDRIVFRDSTSWGSRELRRAVAARWGNGDADWVMATHGASEAIYLAISTLLEPGDEIVALQPVYHSHTSIARTLGCTVRPWRLPPHRAFAPQLADLAGLVTERTRLITVNFPHNPTGVTLSPQQQTDLLGIAAGAGAYLLWDAAFADLVYGGPPLPDPTTTYPRAVSVGTLSKAYGLPGLRFGWCIADPALLERMVRLRDRMTLHLSPLVEFLAGRVAENADLVLAGRLTRAGRNRAEVLRWAADSGDLVELAAPAGGVTTFPRLTGLADTEPLCRRLARRDRTLLVPGNCFGHPDRVRLGFGGPSAGLAAGLSALSAALDRREPRIPSGRAEA